MPSTYHSCLSPWISFNILFLHISRQGNYFLMPPSTNAAYVDGAKMCVCFTGAIFSHNSYLWTSFFYPQILARIYILCLVNRIVYSKNANTHRSGLTLYVLNIRSLAVYIFFYFIESRRLRFEEVQRYKLSYSKRHLVYSSRK